MKDTHVMWLCFAIFAGGMWGGMAGRSSIEQSCPSARLASDGWQPDPDKMLERERLGINVGSVAFHCALEASLWAQFVQASAGDQLRADALLDMWRRRYGRCPRTEPPP